MCGDMSGIINLGEPRVDDAQVVVMVLGALGQVLDLGLVEGLFALVLLHLAEDGVLLERLSKVSVWRVTWSWRRQGPGAPRHPSPSRSPSSSGAHSGWSDGACWDRCRPSRAGWISYAHP
jgi:hypothetical protein